VVSKINRSRTYIFLAGSFCFAFLLGEMIHELGHFLAHRYFDIANVSIHIDPFGNSRIMGVQALPLPEMGITTAAGPALNLLSGIICTLLLWDFNNPALVPLALWGPVALAQEGVNLSLGLLSAGSDARWLVEWGIPSWLLIALGVFLTFLAIILIGRILSKGLVTPEIPFWGKFALIFFGLAFLMILRTLVSMFRTAAAALENLVPLAFACILALAISSGIGLLARSKVDPESQPLHITWKHSLWAAGLGLGILLLQIILP
jgi:hypothetical protein